MTNASRMETTMKTTTTPERIASTISRNTARMLADRTDAETFHARQRRLWRAAAKAGLVDDVARTIRKAAR